MENNRFIKYQDLIKEIIRNKSNSKRDISIMDSEDNINNLVQFFDSKEKIIQDKKVNKKI